MLDWFPTELVLNTAKNVFGEDRMQSQQFRFDNEDMLLLKGSEKFWVGWGGFGRDRVFSPDDGHDLTVQDGYWISIFGQMGFVGFTSIFTVFLLPLLQLKYKVRKLSKFDKRLIAGIGVLAALCAINTLPNMSFPNIHLIFVSGLSVLLKKAVLAKKMNYVKN